MEKLLKGAITAVIIAAGLLVIDLFLCMIAIVCPSIGADNNYASMVLGILITALSLGVSLCAIAIALGIIKIIQNLYK